MTRIRKQDIHRVLMELGIVDVQPVPEVLGLSDDADTPVRKVLKKIERDVTVVDD